MKQSKFVFNIYRIMAAFDAMAALGVAKYIIFIISCHDLPDDSVGPRCARVLYS